MHPLLELDLRLGDGSAWFQVPVASGIPWADL